MRSPGRILELRAAAIVFGILGATTAKLSCAQTVEVFAAGSLRGVVTELTKQMNADYQIEVRSTFGGSGSLRERIEKGEKPDLLMSADMGSPRKLENAGQTAVPTIAFARNRMCLVSRRTTGITPSNMIDRMLKSGMRVRTSTPVADPSGDYAWAIFDRIDAVRSGAGGKLKEKARASMSATATPASSAQSAAAALFASNQIDVSITYCSASAGLVKELPELTSFEVPPRLNPHPVYGVAVLSTKPEALRTALFLMSEKGQTILAEQGLLPVMEAPQ
jgi:ABC-type molybdate transport system substrate-binding protein